MDEATIDALAMAAAYAAMRSPHFAENTLPALRACRGRMSVGSRAGLAHCIDHAIRDHRAGVYPYRELDDAAWRTLQDALLEDVAVRACYVAVAPKRAP